MRLPFLFLVLALLLAGQIRFEDVTKQAGLDFQLKNGADGGFHQIEVTPGGVAAIDFDRDGCMDIFFTNGAASPSLDKSRPEFFNRLYRNDCHGKFTDVTDRAGLRGVGYSTAVAVADFDNDGYPDIFVAGVDRNILYRNQHDGTFKDVTKAAGLEGLDPTYGKLWSISAGWFDADNDGWLDLFVSSYVAWDPKTERPCGGPGVRLYCPPALYRGQPHQIFRNNHDGTFTDMTKNSGIGALSGKGMGVLFGDFNRDGLMDVFVANDTMPNQLFENLGNFHFREVGLEAGVAMGENGRVIAGMGADFRDYNNDGLPDLLVAGMFGDGYQVFLNRGKPLLFEDVSIQSGIGPPTRQFTGWSMGLFDFDNDGWKDVFFALGHFPDQSDILGMPSRLSNRVFRNVKGHFEPQDPVGDPSFYRGSAFADFDNDGKVDVVVTALNAPARLFRNVTANAGHWLAVKLVGTKSNRDGIGAELKAALPDGAALYNQATTSVGYASSSEPLVRFGLGSQTRVRELVVTWPGGKKQTLRDVAADKVIEVREE